MKLWRTASTKRLALLLIALLLASCEGGSKISAHSFSFDGWLDGWAQSTELLEFRYGDSSHLVQRRSDSGLESRFDVWAEMPVAEFLYVRWRLKDAGAVIEERVDLRERLPQDMRDHEVTFVIDGKQLYVYVVTPVEIKQELLKPPLKTWRSGFRQAFEIYPTNQLKTYERTIGTSTDRTPASSQMQQLNRQRQALLQVSGSGAVTARFTVFAAVTGANSLAVHAYSAGVGV